MTFLMRELAFWAMAASTATFNPASLQRYASSTPINYRVIFVSTALIAGCSFVLVETFQRFSVVKGDFDTVNRLDAAEVTPCGLAVPRMRFLMQSLKHISDDPFAEHADAALANVGRSSLCGAETTANAIRVAFQQTSITPVYLSSSQAVREAAEIASDINTREFVCECTKGRCGGGDHGDALRNLNHSYVLAAPAFVRYRENLGETTHCMAGNDPFGSDVCEMSTTVQAQLQAASTNAYELLRGDATASFPDVSQMLYRLTALAVLEYYDRLSNGGACFKNTNAQTATAFCDTVLGYKSSSDGGGIGTIPDPPVTSASKHAYYEKIMDTSMTTCERPEEPEVRSRTFDASYSSQFPVIAICASTLEYGLLDIKRLYGIPDPIGEFEFASGHFGNGFTRWLAGLAYYGLYHGHATNIVADWHTSRIHLKLYLGYRVAATAAWGFASLLACGYLLAYATTPLIKLLYKRIAQKLLLPSAQISTITLKPLGVGEYACTGAAVISGLWLLFVDPSAHSPYYYSSVCTDYANHGGTFPSIAKREPVGVVAATLTAMPSLLVIHLAFFRKKPRNTRIMPLSPFPIYPILILIVLVLIFIIVLSIDVGNEWWDLAKRSPTGNSPGALDSFERIMDNAMIVLLCLGLLLGILNQRSLAANAAMNVPYGRVPVFAVMWCAAALTASGVATGYAFTFIDCSLEHGIDDIVCGDGSTFLTRFLGVVVFSLTACSILIVFFAAFKLLYSIPRRTDVRDATFGLTKRQKVERLTAQQNGLLPAGSAAGTPGGGRFFGGPRFNSLRAGAGRVAGGAGRVAGGAGRVVGDGVRSARSLRFGESSAQDEESMVLADANVQPACFVHVAADEKLPLL
jgi:hypothetical protein